MLQRVRRAGLLALIGALLGACMGSGGGPVTRADLNVLESDDDFAIVSLRRGQKVEDLARIFLGSEGEAWQIREVNGGVAAKARGIVAVPLKPLNPTGVYADAYRTVPILCYHQFTRGDEASQRLEFSARDFEAQLRYMRREGFQFLSFADLAEIMQGKRPIPEKSVVLTIDDGYGSVYDVAWPLLKKYNARATLFIYTDFIGAAAALSWEELREMDASELIEIESHGKSHASLAPIAEDTSVDSYRLRLAKELSGSEAVFMARLGRSPRFLSYPYGNSSLEIARMLDEVGYELAATVTRGANGSFVDPFLLHRTMIYDDHTIDDLKTFLRTSRQH
ncbi:MAG: polysaccharide deacetylase family protein [Pseudomonadota bacterium]